MLRYCNKQSRKYFSHVEWSSATVFISVGSLVGAMIAYKNFPWYVLAAAILLLVALAAVAGHNSYVQRSIDRIAQYDRDFRSMKNERFKAARFCLGKGGKQSDVDEVLDFFDTPIGTLNERGFLEDDLVYDFFFEWIRGYWSTCKDYVESQKDKTNWGNFRKVYLSVSEIHRQRHGSNCVFLLEGQQKTKFLEAEFELAEDLESAARPKA
jgi:hypothetical protein